MLKTTSQALAAALALIAVPAFTHSALAQDATPSEEQPEAAAETSTDAPEDTSEADATAETADDAADTPADEAPADEAAVAQSAATEEGEAPGSYYAKSEHGDWMIRCIRADQGKDPCEMYKLLSDQNDNAVAEFSLVPLTNGDVAAGATLVAPLETDLIEGVGMQIDGGEVRGYPFAFCAPVGCVSRLGFTKAELAGLKGGREATLQLLPFGGDPEKPVRLPVSLTGFTAAFDELSAYAQAPEAEAEEETEEAPAE
ncbi:invasion associated locus B family protein [Paracoccus zeaxanthinifaciens]|uniref:invasion associated locus B family protein n=1 Tax=Paracoccus zeaxanthinifaciens TaxID=187400 RepID=UPI000424F06E|nr:invasion associated locus B family protein [Paracoccus zeaxanthinifaciens]